MIFNFFLIYLKKPKIWFSVNVLWYSAEIPALAFTWGFPDSFL